MKITFDWSGSLGSLAAACFAVCLSARSDADERIYRCDSNGTVTFSDKGCSAPDIQSAGLQSEMSLRPLNTFSANPPSQALSASSKNATKSAKSETRVHDDSIANDQQQAKLRCQRLADRLDTIQQKMRLAHSADQGERMRLQQRQLEQQRRTDKCR